MVGEQLKRKVAAQDVLPEQIGFAGLGKRGFKALVAFKNFAVDVVVACGRAHGVAADYHAFNQCMRVEQDDVAVFECARLALVGVANHVFLPFKGARHKAPFQARGEARATAPTQVGCFEFVDDVVLRRFFADNFAQGLVAAALDVFVQRPTVGVLGIDIFENDT